MITHSTQDFSPEVVEYMLLNGYKLLDNNADLGLLTFTRGSVAVLFFQDKVERRIISSDKDAVYRTTKSFKGFDGKDIFKLMMILHLLDAVDLKEVKKRVDSEEGKLFRELLDDLLSTMIPA